MPERPRLKSVTVHSLDGEVILWQRALKRVYLDDKPGSVAALLKILEAGEHRTPDLPQAMAQRGFTVTDQEITAVLSALDELGVLEEADGDNTLDAATLALALIIASTAFVFWGLARTLARTLRQLIIRPRLLEGAARGR